MPQRRLCPTRVLPGYNHTVERRKCAPWLLSKWGCSTKHSPTLTPPLSSAFCRSSCTCIVVWMHTFPQVLLHSSSLRLCKWHRATASNNQTGSTLVSWILVSHLAQGLRTHPQRPNKRVPITFTCLLPGWYKWKGAASGLVGYQQILLSPKGQQNVGQWHLCWNGPPGEPCPEANVPSHLLHTLPRKCFRVIQLIRSSHPLVHHSITSDICHRNCSIHISICVCPIYICICTCYMHVLMYALTGKNVVACVGFPPKSLPHPPLLFVSAWHTTKSDGSKSLKNVPRPKLQKLQAKHPWCHLHSAGISWCNLPLQHRQRCADDVLLKLWAKGRNS